MKIKNILRERMNYEKAELAGENRKSRIIYLLQKSMPALLLLALACIPPIMDGVSQEPIWDLLKVVEIPAIPFMAFVSYYI